MEDLMFLTQEMERTASQASALEAELSAMKKEEAV
jgi:hypothetical protein